MADSDRIVHRIGPGTALVIAVGVIAAVLCAAEPRTVSLAVNTLLLAGATCAVSVPLGSLLAVALFRTDLPGRRGWVLALVVLLFVPLYVHAAAWQAGLGSRGWVTELAGMPAWIDGWRGAIWVHAMAAVPWAALIVGFGLSTVEPELEEQALLDGSTRTVLLRVTLPAALPAVALATLWVAVTTAGQMTVTDLFGVRTYAEEVYTGFATGSTPGFVLPMLAVGLAAILCAGLGPKDRPPTFGRRPVFALGKQRRLAALGVAVLMVLLVGVPLVDLLHQAGMMVEPAGSGWHRWWSPGKCLRLVATAPWRHRRELGWSLGIGALAVAASVALAVPLAWLARGRKWKVLPAVAVAAACLAIPEPVVALGIIKVLNRPELPWLTRLYDYSILAPWLALVIRGLPIAILVLWHAFRSVPSELLQAAKTDGAGPAACLLRVALPARRSALGLAWLAALVFGLGELAGSILVAPPGVTMLSVRIFDMLHSGVDDRAAAICLALILLVSLAVVVPSVVLWRRDRARTHRSG